MIEIIDNRITHLDGIFIAKCVCGNSIESKFKASVLKSLRNGRCRGCMTHYSNTFIEGIFMHDGKWSCKCFSCGETRSYTRKDHALCSFNSKTSCRKCSAKHKSNNSYAGWSKREYNKYSKSAKSRGILWAITEEYIRSIFNGKCALTGWDISMKYGSKTASLDRIDSNLGYIAGNVQWVHSMVNMSKNKYSQDDFIRMCSSVHMNMLEFKEK